MENERILVCLNFSDAHQSVERADLAGAGILACTHLDRRSLERNLVLRPNEGLTLLL
jgi:hypothetical protein